MSNSSLCSHNPNPCDSKDEKGKEPKQLFLNKNSIQFSFDGKYLKKNKLLKENLEEDKNKNKINSDWVSAEFSPNQNKQPIEFHYEDNHLQIFKTSDSNQQTLSPENKYSENISQNRNNYKISKNNYIANEIEPGSIKSKFTEKNLEKKMEEQKSPLVQWSSSGDHILINLQFNTNKNPEKRNEIIDNEFNLLEEKKNEKVLKEVPSPNNGETIVTRKKRLIITPPSPQNLNFPSAPLLIKEVWGYGDNIPSCDRKTWAPQFPKVYNNSSSTSSQDKLSSNPSTQNHLINDMRNCQENQEAKTQIFSQKIVLPSEKKKIELNEKKLISEITSQKFQTLKELEDDKKVIKKEEHNFKKENSVSVPVTLKRSNLGLGFFIEGGANSPKGDLPICVKRVTRDNLGLVPGDLLLKVNDVSLEEMTSYQAWKILKKFKDDDFMTLQVLHSNRHQ